MIISLLVTGQPKKTIIFATRYLPPPKNKYRLARYSLLSLKKSIVYFISRYCPLKKSKD